MDWFSFLFIFYVIHFPSSFAIPKLVIVSFDGFRFDYLNRNLTPHLNSLKTLGTYSRFLINVFPTQTFTNHFTLATGLYAETHGVLASSIYDSKERGVLEYGSKMFHYNDKITPIWSQNEKKNPEYRSGSMMWPGGEFTYNGINITFSQPFNYKMNWEDRVDTIMNWMKHPKTPANLVLIYFEQPDLTSHAFGPDSKQTDDQIVKVDSISKYILDSLDKNKLLDVNVIFISDHGMEKVPKENIMNLLPVVGDLCDMYGASPVLQVYPKPGVSKEVVFKKLSESAFSSKNFKVFKKEDVPDYLHYKNCERAPPIVIIANPPYAFQDLFTNIEEYKKIYNISGSGPFGVHGYDPRTINMHPFFLAKGPIFKRKYTSKYQIESIDLYPLFSYILQLELPSVKPNGSIVNVMDIFENLSSAKNVAARKYVLGISVLASFIIILSIIYLYFQYRGKKAASRSKQFSELFVSDFDQTVESQEPLLNSSDLRGDTQLPDG